MKPTRLNNQSSNFLYKKINIQNQKVMSRSESVLVLTNRLFLFISASFSCLIFYSASLERLAQETAHVYLCLRNLFGTELRIALTQTLPSRKFFFYYQSFLFSQPKLTFDTDFTRSLRDEQCLVVHRYKLHTLH